MLGNELRDIGEGLRRSQKRDQFKLEQRLAVRPRDIQRAMLDVSPQIVHFSGHGTGISGLAFEDERGDTRLVDGAALASLFSLFSEKVKCVVLNGCYSSIQAQEISKHIDYVIGMNKGIGDHAAIEFSVGFYDALGAGRSIEFAHRLGCSSIQLSGIPEHLTPVLLKKSGGRAPIKSSTGAQVYDSTTDFTTHSPSFESVASTSENKRLSRLFNPRFRFVLLTNLSVITLITVIRLSGALEFLELRIYDYLLRLRTQESMIDKSRITVIEATAADHRIKREKKESGPGAVSNEALNEVLQKLEQTEYKPAVIALDIYRDSPTDPLVERFSQTLDLFAVCETPSEKNEAGVDPPLPEGIPPEHIGFSNFLTDTDGTLRRQLVEMPPQPNHSCQARKSLGLLVALRYIEKQIGASLTEQDIWVQEDNLSLNDKLIERIKGYSFGGYQYLDANGVQFLLNYQTPRKNLREVSPHFQLEDVRQGKVSGEYLKDKIVLIGVTDRSEAVDYVQTPYGETAGVTIHAHMINQLVSTALDGRNSIWALPQWVEGLCFFGVVVISSFLSIRITSHKWWLVTNGIELCFVYGVCVLTMNLGSGWLPMLPAMIGLTLSGTIVHCRYYVITRTYL